ncbi:MAG: hypothetical protein ACK533_04335 [Planctomycetota bacterium]
MECSMRHASFVRLCPFVLAALLPAQGAGFEPPVLQTVLNSTSFEGDPHLSLDGLTLWFTSSRPGGLGGTDIYSATRPYLGGPWNAPVLETALNSAQTDGAPFVVLGDLEIYFVSSRTGSIPNGATPSSDIWRATRSAPGQPWGTPTNVAELNSSGTESLFSMTLDGTECYFTTSGWGNPAGTAPAIFRATRSSPSQPWSTPALVTELANGRSRRDVEISFDGLQIVFNEQQPAPISRLYVFAATRPDRNSPFGTPVVWSEFNTVGTSPGVNGLTVSAAGDEAILAINFPTATGGPELMRARRSVAYGLGCGGATPLTLSSNAPNIGGNWNLATANIDPVSPIAITFFGGAPTALPLAALGAPGCTVLVDTPFVSLAATNVGGAANLAITVPAALALVGQTFFTQSACLTTGNLLGLYASNGLKSVLGG